MSTPARPKVPSLIPHLVCDDAAAAIDFYKAAFGAVEAMRLPGPGGRLMHAALRIGDSALMLVDEFPEMGSVGPQALKGSPVTLHLFVPDVDATLAQAERAGATVTMPAQDMFWGDRYGQLSDPFGHMWSLAQHVEDVAEADMPKRAAEAFKQMAAAGK